ncbi:hypothetical protein GCM10027035_46060 [Emticicia sediminis]
MKNVLLSFTQKLIAVFIILELCSTSTFAGSGIFESYVIVQANGGSANYYDLFASTGNPDFQGLNLGVFSCVNSLVIKGGQNKTYKNGTDNILNGYLYYRVYKNGTDPNLVSFTSINLGFDINLNGSGDQQWTNAGATANILQGLTNGTYTIEVYSSADFTYSGGSGTHYQNIGGANYKATFTVSNPINITTQPLTPAAFCSGTNVTLTAAATGADGYIWQEEISAGNWLNISGANGSMNIAGETVSLTLTSLATSKKVRCLFTNCGGINTLPTSGITLTPQRPSISLQPISQTDCDGNTVDFTIAASVGSTFVWQCKKPSDADFLTVSATTNLIITSTSTTSELKVKNIGNAENPHLSIYRCVVSDANSCSIISNQATLSVNSINNIADSPAICTGGSTSFLATFVGITTSIKWQKGTVETTAGSYSDLNDSSPNILGTTTNTLSLSNVPFLDNNTFYRVRAVFTTVTNSGTGTCTKTQVVSSVNNSGKLIVNALPTAPTANNASRCDVGTVTLSATSTLNADESFRWYETNVSTTVLGTAATYTTTSLAVGTYTYYLSVYNNSTTCESIRTPVTVIVNAIPTITLGSVADICNSATSFSLPILATTNSPNQYSISVGSPALSNFLAINNATMGSSPIDVTIPANATPNTYQFIVSVKNSSTTCISPDQIFTIKINDTPVTPTVTNPINYCQNASTTILSAIASGSNSLLWYGTSPSNGTSSLIAPTPSSSIIGTTSYYVSQKNANNCESSRALISVVVHAVPVAPATSSINYCQNATAGALTATNSGSNTLLWYGLSSVAGTASTAATTPSTASIGTFAYYVSQISPAPANCESPRASIPVTINDLPPTPTVATPVLYCQNSTASALSATSIGTNALLWYGTNAVGGTSSGAAPSPLTSSTGTTSYFVSQKDANNCESLRAKIDVVVTPSVSASISGTNAFCITGVLNSSTILTANPTGGNGSYSYQWQNLAGNIATATSQTLTVNSTVQSANSDTYRITIMSGNCTTTAAITVTKQGWSDIPNVSVSPIGDICESGIKTLNINSPSAFGIYKWFIDASTLTQTQTGTSFSTPNLTSTTTYYVAREQQSTANLTCQTARTAIVINVNAIPETPTIANSANKTTFCNSESGFNLSISCISGSAKYRLNNGSWTDGSLVSISPSTYNSSTILNYDFKCSLNTNCESGLVSTSITINPVPNAPTVSGNTSICLGASTTLTASGCSGTVVWSNGTSGTSIIVSSAGTYNATCLANICVSLASATQMVIVNSIPSAPTIVSDDADNIVCAGTNVKLTVSDCVGTVVWSNGTSGTSIIVSSSGTYNATCSVNGCMSAASSVQNIVVNQNPTITLGIINSICNAATIFDLPYTSSTNSPDKYTLTSTMPDFMATAETNLLVSPITITIPSGKTGTHSFTLNLKNSTTNCINSQTFSLTVLPALLGGSIEVSSSTINCAGYNPGVISSVSVASGGRLDYVYQWQSSTDNQNFTDIPGENLTTYNPPAITQTTYYRRKVTDACGIVVYSSNVHQVQIVADPQITLTDANERVICSGESVNLEATVIGGSGACNATWESSATQTGTYSVEQAGGLSFSKTLINNSSSTPLVKYYRVVYDCSGTGSSACGRSISSSVRVRVNYVPNAPIVSGNTTICVGNSTLLTASGCAGTVTWSDSSTGSTLSVSSAGTYSATCTENSCVSLPSNIFNLTVNPIPNAPTVISDDIDNTVCDGTIVKLSVSDCGGTVVWSNSTSATSINVSSSGTYNAICVVNNCASVASTTQTVVVNTIPTAPIISGNISICSGNSTTLTASGCLGVVIWNTGATSSALNVSTSGTYNAACVLNDCVSAVSQTKIVSINSIPIAPIISGNSSFCVGGSTTLTANGCSGMITWSTGTTGSILSVSSAGTYSATCTENLCISAQSLIQTVSVNPLPTISLETIDNICNTATTFGISYTATTNAPDKFSLTSTMPDFITITEEILPVSPILVAIPPARTGIQNFTLNIKNSTTGCNNTQTFSVTILPALAGGSIELSSSSINCSGYNAGVISNVSLASGGKADYVYQWQSSTDNQNFLDISGANTTAYDPPALTETTYYRRKVTDACGADAVSSNVYQIQVVPDPQITITDAAERTICSGGNISLDATVIGGSGMCTPTWQSSLTPSGAYNNEQVGGLSFTKVLTNNTTATIIKYYRAIYGCSGAGSGSCNQGVSSVVKVTVNPVPNTPIITPASVVICPNQSAILTASGCVGIVTWNGGQTGSTLSVSEAGSYSANCVLSSCISTTSSLATVTLASGGTPVDPPIISGTATICNGQSTTLTATNCSGLVTWSDGTTGAIINVSPSISVDYTATCFDGTCTSNNSNKISITVNSYPTITTQPKNEADCNGNSVTFRVIATSVTTYQWQRKMPNGTFTDIVAATSNALTISDVGSASDPNLSEYRVVVSNTVCSLTSTAAVLTVNSVEGSLADQTICDGANASFNLSAITISGNIQGYQWQRRIGTSGTWNDIADATATTFTINAATNADEQYYRCKVNFSTGGSTTCARYTTEDDSNGAKLNVLIASKPNIIGTNVICLGRSTTLTANNCEGIFAWSSGQSTATISVSPTNNTSYTVSCTLTQCGFNVSSAPFLVTVNSTPQPEIITYDVISPATLTFAARITVPDATLMWYNRALGGTGTTTAPSFSAVGTYSYWVTQTDPISGCESVRLPIIAKVLNYFHITQQPLNQVDCRGNSVYFGVVAVGSKAEFTYQWQRKRPNDPDFVNLVEDGKGIRGWYAKEMAVSNVGDANNPDQTQYRCIIGNNGQFLTSEISTLTVNSLVGSMPNLGICIGATNEFNLQNYFTITGNVMSYQWQTRPGTSGAWTNLTDGNGIVGSSTSILKFTKATYEQGVYYRCLVKFNTQGFECTEPTDAAKLIVSGFPPAPSVSSVFYCQNANAVRLKVDSPIQNLVWYTQEVGGSGFKTAPTPSTSIAGVFRYYVSDRTDEGCEGPRAVINVSVGALPPAPKNTTLSPIYEGNTLTFSAEGTPVENQVLRWYTTPTTSTFSTVAPVFTAAGIYTRYVAQVSAFGCVGQRTAITATIIPSLKFTKQPASEADCDGNSVIFRVTATAPSAFTYQWQRQRPSETSFIDLPNEMSNSLKISDIGNAENPNLTKYRCIIKDDKNTVISEEAILTVNQIVGKLATMSLCDGNVSKLSFSSLSITGNVLMYQWQKKTGSTYTDIPTNANGIAIINEIGTYRGRITFLVDKTTTCNRSTEDLKVELKPSPIAPEVSNQFVCQNIVFDIMRAVSATNSLLWYDSATDTTADKTTPKIDITKLNKTTYYVSQITPFGCESERKSFNVEVSAIPEKPIVSDVAYCRNAPSLALTATTLPQNTVVWYASLTAKDAFGQTPIPDTKTDGEIIYFAATRNLASCESERLPLKVSISPCIANFENNFNNCLQVSADSVRGNKWFDLHDNSGRIYASVNPNGLNLGKVSISIRHYGRGSSAIPATKNDTKLMARYVDFQSSLLSEFPIDVSLRIYYLNEELNEYKTSTNLPNLTINDFNILHYDGIREDCGFENNDNFSEGDSYVIYKTVIGNQIAKDFFYLQFDVNKFSENGATANDFTEISFSGKEIEAQSVQLNWQSHYEIKADKYILERSEDCKNFVKIGEIKANGSASTYESVDYQPFAGKNCYRLVYIDKDGTKKYLDAIEANFTNTDPICSVFPNPWTKGDEINLYLRNIKAKTIKLYDMSGKDLSFSTSKNESQVITIRPDVHLTKGIHFVVITGEDNKKCVQKVVINP